MRSFRVATVAALLLLASTIQGRQVTPSIPQGSPSKPSIPLEELSAFLNLDQKNLDTWRIGTDPWHSAAVISPKAVSGAPGNPTAQTTGSTVLQYARTQTVITSNEPTPRWFRARDFVARFFTQTQAPWALAASVSPSAAGRQSSPSSGSVTAVFISLGRSSGEAFRMEIVNDSPVAVGFIGAGFVLEPTTARLQDIERELGRLKGRRSSAIMTAYCMEFLKPPPVMDMIYRLVPRERATKFSQLAPIMVASKKLLDEKALHPDSDPEEYFHSIRQWALWTDEQGWKTQDAFAQAFIAHAQKNYAAAGRPWTPQVENGIKRIIPGRWRDIEAVLSERDILLLRPR